MIKSHFENMCVDCPMGCIHCGRKHVEVFECSKCGDESTNPEFDGWDMEEGLCAECREQED